MGKINGILLVDDDKVNNFISCQLIENLGITDQVHISYNGRDAINYIQNLSFHSETCPELILLDIEMPVMDGYEFLEVFNSLTIKNKEAIKVIILTASHRHEDIEKSKILGVDYFLSKPLNKQKFKKILNSLN